MKRSKRIKQAEAMVEKRKAYPLEEAISLLKKMPPAKFDQTVEVAFRLGVDLQKPEELVRGTVSLPHGSGKKVRIAVFAKGEEVNDAREAGADFVGGSELVEKVASGWLEFDVAVSTPAMMKEVGKLGRILGPRGLMPNPKSGTVTDNLRQIVEEVRSGRSEFKMDKSGLVHAAAGKISFSPQALAENISAVIAAVERAKPPTVKGQYIRSISVSATMSPGVRLAFTR